MDEAAEISAEVSEEEPVGSISEGAGAREEEAEEAAPEEEHAEEEEEEEEEEEVITSITQLPTIPQNIVEALTAQGIEEIVDLLNMEEEDLRNVPGLSEEDVATIKMIIEESVEIVDEEEEEE
ncbi:MAG: DNA-directed RNA polymerase subunit alpha C-terminal domain-containing protein [Spirochaetaceae bacterium]